MLSSLGWVMRKLMLIERREVCLWHKADVRTALMNVRFEGNNDMTRT
jgi:hypothetical protein